jgi:hypothetical protein
MLSTVLGSGRGCAGDKRLRAGGRGADLLCVSVDAILVSVMLDYKAACVQLVNNHH